MGSANLVRKMEQNPVVCSFMPIVGKNRGYGGDCPGEHPNNSGRTQSRTQPSKPRHCRLGKTGGRQPTSKEIPPRGGTTAEGCARVCTRRKARSIVNVSEAEKEHAREAVEGRRGLRRERELLVPVLAAIRAVFFSLSFTLLPAAQRRGRGVGASRRILSARWQPTRGMSLSSR